MKNLLSVAIVSTILSPPLQAAETHDAFFEALRYMCGEQYQAKVVEGNESDDTWRNSTIIMDVVECYPEKIEILLSVGQDTSRRWIIFKAGEGLTFQHYHMNDDGTPADIAFYGGSTTTPGTASVQQFPADEYSKALFLKNGLDISVNNIWVLMIDPQKHVFSYRLQRPGRVFQIDFDLTQPLS